MNLPTRPRRRHTPQAERNVPSEDSAYLGRPHIVRLLRPASPGQEVPSFLAGYCTCAQSSCVNIAIRETRSVGEK